MLAAVLTAKEELSLEEVETPSPSRDDTIIKVRACGICASDIKTYNLGGSHYFKPPVILGHEYVGEVEETNEERSNLKKGDAVSVIPALSCGRCPHCIRGLFNLCKNKARPSNGGFAEYVRIPAEIQNHSLIKIIGHTRLQKELTLAEPLACCIRAVDQCSLQTGDTVLIVGAGVMGLLLTRVCILRGVRRVFVTETDKKRARLVNERTGIETIDPDKTDIHKVSKEVSDIGGFDCVITTVPTSEVTGTAEAWVRDGGTIHLFAGAPHNISCGLSYNAIHYRQITVIGTSTYSPFDFRRAVNLISSGRLVVSDIITHSMPMERIQEAFRTADSPESLKVVVTI